MVKTHYKYNDGGRREAGYEGTAGDCVVRAISIATGMPYQKVYDDLFDLNRKNDKPKKLRLKKNLPVINQMLAHSRKKDYSPRNGNTTMKTIKGYMEGMGWAWIATMGIGTGCKTHLRAEELPSGRLVVRVSKHLTALIDGVVNDSFDCSRGGTRCVYGYFQKSTESENSLVLPQKV